MVVIRTNEPVLDLPEAFFRNSIILSKKISHSKWNDKGSSVIKRKVTAMKRILSILILLSICGPVVAEALPDYLQDMQEKYKGRIKVWAVEDDDFEDDNDNEFFVLKFESRQDDRDEGKLDYQMRVTVQLTDKRTKEVVYAQATKVPRPLPPNDWYSDHTAWEFRIPFGNLKKPKLTAYAVEFGFLKDSYFVPVGVEYDEVDSAEDILKGGGTKVRMRCTRSAHYSYSH